MWGMSDYLMQPSVNINQQTWETITNYNPDHCPSFSAKFYKDRSTEVQCILQVKGLGVITMRATRANEDGTLQFDGIGILTKSDIGYSPSL
jgi:hypothetical protein